MGQIDQLLCRIAGAPVRTVRRWRSRGISWKVITSNLLPVPSLSIIHHQLLPSRAGNGFSQNAPVGADFWLGQILGDAMLQQSRVQTMKKVGFCKRIREKVKSRGLFPQKNLFLANLVKILAIFF